jgi:hypothetical protein
MSVHLTEHFVHTRRFDHTVAEMKQHLMKLISLIIFGKYEKIRWPLEGKDL